MPEYDGSDLVDALEAIAKAARICEEAQRRDEATAPFAVLRGIAVHAEIALRDYGMEKNNATD